MIDLSLGVWRQVGVAPLAATFCRAGEDGSRYRPSRAELAAGEHQSVLSPQILDQEDVCAGLKPKKNGPASLGMEPSFLLDLTSSARILGLSVPLIEGGQL